MRYEVTEGGLEPSEFSRRAPSGDVTFDSSPRRLGTRLKKMLVCFYIPSPPPTFRWCLGYIATPLSKRRTDSHLPVFEPKVPLVVRRCSGMSSCKSCLNTRERADQSGQGYTTETRTFSLAKWNKIGPSQGVQLVVKSWLFPLQRLRPKFPNTIQHNTTTQYNNTIKNPLFKHDNGLSIVYNACGIVYYLTLTTTKVNETYSFDFY